MQGAAGSIQHDDNASNYAAPLERHHFRPAVGSAVWREHASREVAAPPCCANNDGRVALPRLRRWACCLCLAALVPQRTWGTGGQSETRGLAVARKRDRHRGCYWPGVADVGTGRNACLQCVAAPEP